MPRPARLLLSKSYYHVMTRGNNRYKVFQSDDDFNYYLHLIKKYKLDHPFDLFHYCLMPNHTHFLIKTNKASEFSVFMKKLSLAYFQYYKKQYDWVGHFWQGRFKSQPVGKDKYFIQCGKYIELNPVRANLMDNPKDYQWSSYNYYINNRKDSLISEDKFYEDMGNTSEERSNAYQQLIINDIISENYNKEIWGTSTQTHNELQKIKNHQQS